MVKETIERQKESLNDSHDVIVVNDAGYNHLNQQSEYMFGYDHSELQDKG
jgi:hypothetical protein